MSEKEKDIPSRRNSISKGSEACFVWKGVESGGAYHQRLGKSGKGWRREGNRSYMALKAKLWRLDFIPQATERHLRLFDRFAIQDGHSDHSMEN